MLQMRNKRLRKQRAKEEPQQRIRRVSDKQLFASMGVVPKVVTIH